MTKPVELKNLKQDFSVDFIPNKCKFGVWVVNENDVYIQCRDWFSPSFQCDCCLGAPISVRTERHFPEKKTSKKFIYDDNWGDVVLRNEAWVVFRDMLDDMRSWEEWQRMEIGIRMRMCRKMEETTN